MLIRKLGCRLLKAVLIKSRFGGLGFGCFFFVLVCWLFLVFFKFFFVATLPFQLHSGLSPPNLS